MAHHGTVGDEEQEGEETNGSSEHNSKKNEQGQDSLQGNNGLHNARNSSDTRVGSQDGAQYNEVSGVKIDPEKGRDAAIVTWYSDHDSEVSAMIWSQE